MIVMESVMDNFYKIFLKEFCVVFTISFVVYLILTRYMLMDFGLWDLVGVAIIGGMSVLHSLYIAHRKCNGH